MSDASPAARPGAIEAGLPGFPDRAALPPARVEALRARLLPWYEHHARSLPWRGARDPYRIWVSEAMLQQTRVETVLGRWEAFLARFPTLAALAEAPEQAVLEAWTGLGYYRRARALHQGARAVRADHAGVIPDDPDAFAALPGVGPYTTGAVMSIAFGRRLPAVDANAIRVLARWFALDGDPARLAWRRRVTAIAAALVAAEGAAAGAEAPRGPGAWNQAVMELGATVCTARRPRCERCPVADLCEARERGDAEALPARTQRRAAPEVEVVVAACIRQGRLLVVRRPDRGLLAGMWGLPAAERGGRRALGRLLGVRLGPVVRTWTHAFTHRVWRARLVHVDVDSGAAAGCGGGAEVEANCTGRTRQRGAASILEPDGAEWLDRRALAARPFPTAFRPAVEAALALLL